MAQEIYLKQNTDDPIFCLKTGDVVLLPNNEGVNPNSKLVLFLIHEVADTPEYIADSFKEDWISFFESEDEDEFDEDSLSRLFASLSDDYLIIHLDTSEGPLVESSLLILDYRD